MGMREDVAAMCDMLKDIAEQSDALKADEAVKLLDELLRLKKQAAEVAALVESQAKRVLEQPIQVGSVLYAVKPAGKYRPDHGVVKRSLVDWSLIDRATGETFDREQAVERAVGLCYDAFVAPATMPKKGLLDKLGLDRKDIAHWEQTGTELVRTDIGGGEPE